MKAKKSLQRFTHFSQVENREQFDSLPEKLAEKMRAQMSDELSELHGAGEHEKFDAILSKVLSIIDEKQADDVKNSLWQKNHINILACIHNSMINKNCLPTIGFIVKETGLSKPTVYKHLKEFDTSKFYADHWKMFKFMEIQLMSKLYDYATRGDMKAAKLYFDRLGSIPKYQSQNNFIQINNIIIDQKSLEALPEEKKRQIIDLIAE